MQQRVQYLNIRCVSLAVPPRSGHRREGAVSMVKLSSLEVEEERGEGFLLIRNKCSESGLGGLLLK